jgi:hypothetical protein
MRQRIFRIAREDFCELRESARRVSFGFIGDGEAVARVHIGGIERERGVQVRDSRFVGLQLDIQVTVNGERRSAPRMFAVGLFEDFFRFVEIVDAAIGLHHADFGLQVVRCEAQGFLVTGNRVWKLARGCRGAALLDERGGLIGTSLGVRLSTGE